MTAARWVVERFAHDLGVTYAELAWAGLRAIVAAPFVLVGFWIVLTATAVLQELVSGVAS